MDRLATSLFLLFAAEAPETVSRPEWQRAFERRGARGTFALHEPATNRYPLVDPARARPRFAPGSTFDVANALIGLEVGAIADELEVFRWDGAPRPFPAWERDHTLASGLREGVAWMFQEVARRTGKARMREALERLRYGNRELSGGIDHFWLQGGLRVSALEQLELLYPLAEGRLALTQRAQRLVRTALVAEKTREHTLYAKSGIAGGKAPLAWWIGWVERRGRLAGSFALHYTPLPGAPAEERVAIGRELLEEAGLLPPAAR